MKVIGFTASPRKTGNTAWIVDKILEGAEEHGAETESWYFSDLDIKPCRGCNGCKKGNQECVIHDDMQKIYHSLENADAVVLGSPVYFAQMTAQAKIFTDRLYAKFSPRFSPYFKERAKKIKLILVFTQGNPDSSLFKSYFDYTREMFKILEFDAGETQVIAGMRTEAAHAKKDLDTEMKRIGSFLTAE